MIAATTTIETTIPTRVALPSAYPHQPAPKSGSFIPLENGQPCGVESIRPTLLEFASEHLVPAR